MKLSTVAVAFAALLAAGTIAPSISQAANARHPYKNVNRANDKGNRSGDSETARLNQQQIDQHRNGQ